MNRKIKSINLSIDEITQLLSIDNADERQRVIDALLENAAEPHKSDPQRYVDSHPMALCLVHKINRRADQQRRRAQARQRRKELKEEKEKAAKIIENIQPTATLSPSGNVTIELNRATVGRLLWIKQHHNEWVRNFFAVFNAMQGHNTIPTQIAIAVKTAIDNLTAYIKPLIDQAAIFYHTPASRRPRALSI